jgi:hypothetical protein
MLLGVYCTPPMNQVDYVYLFIWNSGVRIPASKRCFWLCDIMWHKLDQLNHIVSTALSINISGGKNDAKYTYMHPYYYATLYTEIPSWTFEQEALL